MGRKICTECNTIFDDKVLIEKKSENCLVCGASLRDMDEPQLAQEEELVTWYYYLVGTKEHKIKNHTLTRELIQDDEMFTLEYKFVAPDDSDKAKEVLRKEHDSNALAPYVSTNPEPIVRCPRCGCTSVQLIPRKWSILTGYHTNAVNRVCVNCKHKW